MAGQSVKASKMSSPTKGSQLLKGISSTRWTAGAPLGVVPVNKSASHRPDLVGRQFGSVKIVSPDVLWLGAAQRRFIHVVCECQKCRYRSVVSLSNLENGRTGGCRACGRPAPAYPSWLYARVQAQKHRCENPNNPQYSAYGGRGIKFNFSGVKAGTLWIMENLGIPEDYKFKDLDRINPDGNYEPGNLRWLERRLNLVNRSGDQPTAKMHWFRLRHPQVRYGDHQMKKLILMGLSPEQIVERWNEAITSKNKRKFGTYSMPDLTIASLVTGF